MSDYTQGTSDIETSCYKTLGELNQYDIITTSQISSVISCMREDLSSKIDIDIAHQTFVHMSGDFDIGTMSVSGELSVASNLQQGNAATIGTSFDGNISTGILAAAFNKSMSIGKQSFAANEASAYSKNSTAFGNSKAYGSYTLAHGAQTNSYGYSSHSEGEGSYTGKSDYIGNSSLSQEFGAFAHAEGCYTNAYASYSHTEGNHAYAEGKFAHAEGSYTSAFGDGSHVEGYLTYAKGAYSHAEGDQTYAEGQKSHAEGGEVSAFGFASHAEGRSTVARANYSHAEGVKSETQQDDIYSYVWQGERNGKPLSNISFYQSHGQGTFNINPVGGTKGFYIGISSFNDYLSSLSNGLNSEISCKLDKRTGGIVSGNVDISGNLSALNDITTSSGIHAFKHGLVGKDVDFSTGGDEVLVVGHEHKIYGKESFVAGNEGNILGAKAFHWKAIDTTNSLIYLTHEQTKFNASKLSQKSYFNGSEGDWTTKAEYKKYDIPYFGPKDGADSETSAYLFSADLSISILKENVQVGTNTILGAKGKQLLLNNVLNEPYMRKLTVLSVIDGSVLSVSGLENIADGNKCTHYRKNYDKEYHPNHYIVCFPDVPLISTLVDTGLERNMTFGCATLGEANNTIGYNSFAIGKDNKTEGNYSIALGINARARSNNSFAWSGNGAYSVSGEGQFGINPKSGISGFYIGDKSLAYYLNDLSGDLDGEIQNKLDKRYGGIVSGDVGVFQHDMKILSGNYIQTNDDSLSVQNFSYKNAFLQAECPDSRWGIACTGAKGYCILSVNSPERKIKLSGDISLLESNKSEKYSWSFGSGGDCQSFEISTINVDDHIITLKNAIPNDLYKEISGLTSEEEYKHLFDTDDNAFYCPSKPDIGNTVIHNFYANHAEGGSVKAIGKYTHAEGRGSIADMRYSHAEGDRTVAGRMASHAEGQESKAYGHYSHAEGYRTQVQNDSQAAHAEGYNTTARGNGSHAEGKSTNKCENPSAVDSDVITAWNSKKFTLTKSEGAHAEGADTLALSRGTHAEGVETIAQGSTGAHAEGNLTKATGTTSHAEGIKTVASGFASHTEGYQTSATISAAHAEGYLTYAKGAYSHAEGNQTSAIGVHSHAQGEKTKAQRDNAHAAGFMCEANAWNSTAIGRYSRVLSTDSNAFVWQGLHENTFYDSKGVGTFCINPKDSALSNVWIGSRNLSDIIGNEIDSAKNHSDSAVQQLKSQISSALITIAADPLSSLTYSSDIDNVISAAVEMRNILSSLYDAMKG